MSVLGLNSKDRESTRDEANISNPKVNRGCAPLTANRISADCVQISLGPSIPYIPLGVYHTGGFNAMGRVNSVVNAMELHARCEGRWTYKNECFSRYQETIYQYWEIKMISILISRYCKNFYGFTDVGTYLPILVIISLNHEILDKCPFDFTGLLYWHGLTLIPAWISNHMPGSMWDEIAYTFPNVKGVIQDHWDSEMISNFTPHYIQWMLLLIHVRIEKIHVNKALSFCFGRGFYRSLATWSQAALRLSAGRQ